eukprot:scaffold115402_cov51-Phaeocystis_antarctica.AAC.1
MIHHDPPSPTVTHHDPPCSRSGAQRREPAGGARLLQHCVLGRRRAQPLRGRGRGGARYLVITPSGAVLSRYEAEAEAVR